MYSAYQCVDFVLCLCAEQMLVDDAAALPIYFGKNYVLVQPYVKGYELNAMGFAWLNRVSIEEE